MIQNVIICVTISKDAGSFPSFYPIFVNIGMITRLISLVNLVHRDELDAVREGMAVK